MQTLHVSKHKTYNTNGFYQANKNVLVCGAPGTGKTRGFVIPNLLSNTEDSFVINDSKGYIFGLYGDYFKEHGYQVVCIDFVHLRGHYNPFDIIKSEYDILKTAHMIAYMDAVEGINRDPFWDEESEIALSAFIGFLWEFLPKEKQSLPILNDLITNPMDFIPAIDEGVYLMPNQELRLQVERQFSISRSTPSALDRLFLAVAKQKPDAFCLRQYRKFCTSPEKTFGTVLSATLSKLGQYDTKEIREFLSKTDVCFSDIATKKTAVFICVSDNDRTMDGIANILYSQIIGYLVIEADKSLPERDVDLYFDDFATSVKIPDFPRMIASFRSRRINAFLMIQNESQLIAMYKEEAKTIIGSAGTYLYMGNMDIDTIKNVSLRMNIPVGEVIELPFHNMIVHKQGERPFMDECLLLEEYEKEEEER